MNGYQRIHNTFHGLKTDSIPVWLMRQAGRYLPEYRELRKQHGFIEMVKTPELATQVTLQPLERFDLDAAIIFSDILVLPEALGQPYYFKDTKGIGMEYRLESKSCIQKLSTNHISEKLNYVANAIKMVKKHLNQEKALFGFGGSPFTLAAYMVEGQSQVGFPRFMQFIKEQPDAFDLLMHVLTQALIDFFKLQIQAGIDVLQIFDSWGSLCTNKESYYNLSLKWIKKIIQSLPSSTPVILFAKNMSQYADDLLLTGAKGLSLDGSVRLKHIRENIKGDYILQGNLDPSLMCGDIEPMRLQAQAIIHDMQPYNKYIFNLGHGMIPEAKIENVQALIQTIRSQPSLY